MMQRINLIFLVGAARSGTTLLGEQLLSSHPQINYIGEPDYIWDQAIGYKKYDVVTKGDSDKSAKEKILQRLKSLTKEYPERVLLEKTPANCFRIPFITELFPDAKFIHIIRDGREVALSASKEWGAQKSKAIDSKELRKKSFTSRIYRTIFKEAEFNKRFQSISDYRFLPKYLIKLINYLRRQFFKNSNIPWGPKFPGIKQVRKTYSLLTTCAIQWQESVLAAKSSLDQLPKENVLEIKYEEFLSSPYSTLVRICTFMGIDKDEDLLKKLALKVVSGNKEKWKEEIEPSELEDIMNQISFSLQSLGYK